MGLGDRAGNVRVPAAVQGLIELDDGEHLTELSPGQRIFRREKLLLRFEDFVVGGPASPVTLQLWIIRGPAVCWGLAARVQRYSVKPKRMASLRRL